MACATLKRSLDFDPVHSHGRPSKRQRCIPMNVSPSSSPPTSRNADYGASPPTPSPFSELCPKMTPEMMAAGIREEIRRMYRRRQLHFNPNGENSGDSSDSSSPAQTGFSSILPGCNRDRPLFTFRQVGMICERMLNERETQLRQEYERILSMKLSEQYEAFVSFSNDQLHRRFELSETPSYLS